MVKFFPLKARFLTRFFLEGGFRLVVRVGIVQACFNSNTIENAEKIEGIVKKGFREADFIVLPEYSMVNVLDLKPADVFELAESINDSVYLRRLSRIATDLNVYIFAHFIEKQNALTKPLSSSVLIEPNGSLVKVYSKIHLFDAYGYMESNYFSPGKSPSREVVIGDARIRVAICYDLRFPELFRTYALRGANIVVVHGGWVSGFLKEETLNFLVKARAHENGLWITVSNHFGGKFIGRSMIVNPYGIKVLDLGLGEKYVEFEIDLSLVYEVRKKIPVLSKSKEIWDIRFKHSM